MDHTPADPRPLFQPFRWTAASLFSPLPPAHVLPIISSLRDLTAGAALLMELIERDSIASGDEDFRPLFDSVQVGDLMRLAITSMKIASADAANLISWAHTHHQVAAPPGRTSDGETGSFGTP